MRLKKEPATPGLTHFSLSPSSGSPQHMELVDFRWNIYCQKVFDGLLAPRLCLVEGSWLIVTGQQHATFCAVPYKQHGFGVKCIPDLSSIDKVTNNE